MKNFRKFLIFFAFFGKTAQKSARKTLLYYFICSKKRICNEKKGKNTVFFHVEKHVLRAKTLQKRTTKKRNAPQKRVAAQNFSPFY